MVVFGMVNVGIPFTVTVTFWALAEQPVVAE
jgi:hypothetical protein